MKKKSAARSKPCTFYLVRHGETEWNVQRRIQGHADTPLTDAGIRAAEELGRSFQHIDFAAAFSSDLLRAKRTAEIVIADHQLLVKTNQLLREQYFAQYEGVSIDEYRTELRDLIEQRKQLSFQENLNLQIGDGVETHDQTTTRMITFFREVAAAYPGKKVLAVSHGAMIRTFLIRLGVFTYEQSDDVIVQNLSHAIIEADGADFSVKKLVNIHLRGEEES